MITKQDLEINLHQAMKSHSETEKDVIKLILSSIKLFEIEQHNPASPEDITRIIQKEIKIRNETLSEVAGTGRLDLEAKAKSELDILQRYLPSQLSDDELAALVSKAITETNAQTVADMGKVMKILIPQAKGQATPERISAIVRNRLS